MAHLAITLLGPFAASRDGRPITAFESDQVRALLACLALTPGRAHSRATLADLLWPGRPENAARANLRHALSRLRHALADHDPAHPLICADHGGVALAPDVVCDAARFADLADACFAHDHARVERCPLCLPRLREAAGLYTGPLLAGSPLSRSPVFEEWLGAARAEMDQRAADVFAALAQAAELADDARQLCAFARRQLTIDAWLEPAHRQLMRGLVLLGDRHAALAEYETYRALLARELGVAPEAATHTLYERIRADELGAGPGQGIVIDLLSLQGLWTETQYLRLCNQTHKLMEFTDGVIELLAMPTRSHQLIVRWLFLALFSFLQPRGGLVLFAPLRLQIRPGKQRAPDIMLVRDPYDPQIQAAYWLGADVVMEVVSPDDPERDTRLKRADYAEAAIPEYWIVNPVADTISVLALKGTAYTEHAVFGRGEWAVSQLLEGFGVCVDAVLDAR